MRSALALATIGLLASRLEAAPTGWRCGTPARLPVTLATARAEVLTFDMGERTDPPIARDAFGTFVHGATSAHFALKWGDARPVSPEEAALILESLELSFAEYVDELGHRVPLGAPTYLVNAYVGSTGAPAPEIDFAGGYATLDADGYPYLVLSPDLLTDATSIQLVASHELYHVFQVGLPAYGYTSRGGWYYEATAEWAAQEVYPDLAGIYAFAGAYGIRPDLALDTFEDPFSSPGHQYGAFVFPRFLTETTAPPALIRDSWELATLEDDPIDVLARLLADDGASFDDAFAEFAARNAVWDHEDGDAYREGVELYAAAFPDHARPISLDLAASSSDAWTAAPADIAPEAYGYDLVRLRPATRGRHVVAFAGDASGSAGTASAFRVTLVEGGPTPRYTPLVLDGGLGETELTIGSRSGPAFLVVAAQPGARVPGERFGFAARLTRQPSEPDPANDAAVFGCSVATRSRAPFAFLVLLLPLVLFRRAR